MRKTPETIVSSARHELAVMLEKLYAKDKTLKDDIKEKYPMDYYGVKWMSVYEEKSQELSAQIKDCRQALIGLENMLHFMKEGNYERNENI